MFCIDPRLLNDCKLITALNGIHYLLHLNAEVTWFILVPDTDQTELYRLDASLHDQVCAQINRMSEFIQSHFSVDKINVASIGNVVSQMHIHVIGRRRDDAYWPDVVWGKGFDKTYDAKQITAISEQLVSFLRCD